MNWMPELLEALQREFSRTAEGRTNALYDPVRYFLDLGGKRMRPALTLLGCQLFQDDWNPALPPALAVEIFHNFTLVHDDIMDEAPLRRGKETVHTKWNANQAILSGDAMLVLAYQEFAACSPELQAALLPLFNQTALEVCEGQQMDMDFEERSDVTVGEYLEMIRLKTSVLLAAALQMGAITAGASEADQRRIYQFGQDMGLAFQLRDDYLDAFGTADFGKQVGGDILCDKKTYLLIRAFEKAGSSERAVLDTYIGQPVTNGDQKVAAVKEVMTSLAVQTELLQLSDEYYAKALNHLDHISVDEGRKVRLRELAAWLMQRTT